RSADLHPALRNDQRDAAADCIVSQHVAGDDLKAAAWIDDCTRRAGSAEQLLNPAVVNGRVEGESAAHDLLQTAVDRGAAGLGTRNNHLCSTGGYGCSNSRPADRLQSL